MSFGLGTDRSVLEGFTVRRALLGRDAQHLGGGVELLGSLATVRCCVVEASESGIAMVPGFGGGPAGFPTIESCIVRQNVAPERYSTSGVYISALYLNH